MCESKKTKKFCGALCKQGVWSDLWYIAPEWMLAVLALDAAFNVCKKCYCGLQGRYKSRECTIRGCMTHQWPTRIKSGWRKYQPEFLSGLGFEVKEQLVDKFHNKGGTEPFVCPKHAYEITKATKNKNRTGVAVITPRKKRKRQFQRAKTIVPSHNSGVMPTPQTETDAEYGAAVFTTRVEQMAWMLVNNWGSSKCSCCGGEKWTWSFLPSLRSGSTAGEVKVRCSSRGCKQPEVRSSGEPDHSITDQMATAVAMAGNASVARRLFEWSGFLNTPTRCKVEAKRSEALAILKEQWSTESDSAVARFAEYARTHDRVAIMSDLSVDQTNMHRNAENVVVYLLWSCPVTYSGLEDYWNNHGTVLAVQFANRGRDTKSKQAAGSYEKSLTANCVRILFAAVECCGGWGDCKQIAWVHDDNKAVGLEAREAVRDCLQMFPSAGQLEFIEQNDWNHCITKLYNYFPPSSATRNSYAKKNMPPELSGMGQISIDRTELLERLRRVLYAIGNHVAQMNCTDEKRIEDFKRRMDAISPHLQGKCTDLCMHGSDHVVPPEQLLDKPVADYAFSVLRDHFTDGVIAKLVHSMRSIRVERLNAERLYWHPKKYMGKDQWAVAVMLNSLARNDPSLTFVDELLDEVCGDKVSSPPTKSPGARKAAGRERRVSKANTLEKYGEHIAARRKKKMMKMGARQKIRVMEYRNKTVGIARPMKDIHIVSMTKNALVVEYETVVLGDDGKGVWERVRRSVVGKLTGKRLKENEANQGKDGYALHTSMYHQIFRVLWESEAYKDLAEQFPLDNIMRGHYTKRENDKKLPGKCDPIPYGTARSALWKWYQAKYNVEGSAKKKHAPTKSTPKKRARKAATDSQHTPTKRTPKKRARQAASGSQRTPAKRTRAQSAPTEE